MFTSTGGTKVQITRTVYDVPYVPLSGTGVPIHGSNLRNRVAYSAVIDQENTNVPEWRAATFYSYDPHGNVDSLLQDYGPTSVMGADTINRFKLMTYDYDLISGKVNQVSYQPGMADALYHQYTYDAENRLVAVSTSRDYIQWENDAIYSYYRHGPLARVQLGSLGLQGIDYAYTLQGWLKAINPSWKTPTGTTELYDSDGMSPVAYTERDAYKLNLNYFDDSAHTDYQPVTAPAGYILGSGLPTVARRNLYNGNISSQAVDIRQLAAANSTVDGGPLLYNYGYDQLNRISSMDAWAATSSLQASGSGPMSDYAERYGYDPNGNILTLQRNAASGGGTAATATLSYNYLYVKTGTGGLGEYVPNAIPASGVLRLTNQLSSIQVTKTGSSPNPNELGTQAAYNYQYNEIGQLTADNTQQISNVVWNVYGKMLSLTDSGNTITFTYDAAGNRISKTAHGITTWYVRDAQGNVMSVYTAGNAAVHHDSLSQTEVDVYGSSRLGILNLSLNCGSLLAPDSGSLVRGSKLFELTNHLGNVLETVSDKKIQHTSNSSVVDYYLADVINANDNYSFGMLMPGRSYTASSGYRYGFNGKEQDSETKGLDNQIDYGFRIYDPRVGRFLSVDPLTSKYPELTPYQYASNRPIDGVDQDGKEWTLNTPAERLKQSADHATMALHPVREREILAPDMFGNGHIGPESEVRREILGVRWNYYTAIGDNIRGGPLGAIGYIVGGDKGSYIGATFDQISLSVGGFPGETNLSPRYNGTLASGEYKPANEIALPPDQRAKVDLFVNNRPAPNYGVYYDKPLSTDALRVLSSKLGGVEILQVYVLGLDGKSGYYNISYGTKSSVEVPHTGIGTPYLIDHVHPGGNPTPSKADIDLLRKFQAIQAVNGKPVQSSSTIVPEGQNNSQFNAQSKTSN